MFDITEKNLEPRGQNHVTGGRGAAPVQSQIPGSTVKKQRNFQQNLNLALFCVLV